MTRALYTPGPWSLETVKTSCGICHRIGPFPGKLSIEKVGHACIYDDYPRNSNTDELLANARLIAAAPEGFELIKQLEESFTADGTYQQFLPAMRAYLAKAQADGQ